MREQYRPDGYPERERRRDLRKLLPRSKYDVDAVSRLAELGYPAVEPILSDLFKWISNPDWPVCKPIAALLVQFGASMIPQLQRILVAHGGRAIVAPLIREVLPHMQAKDLAPLSVFVEQEAIHGLYEGDLDALELLIRKRLVSDEYVHELLTSKRRRAEDRMSRLDMLSKLLSDDQAV